MKDANNCFQQFQRGIAGESRESRELPRNCKGNESHCHCPDISGREGGK